MGSCIFALVDLFVTLAVTTLGKSFFKNSCKGLNHLILSLYYIRKLLCRCPSSSAKTNTIVLEWMLQKFKLLLLPLLQWMRLLSFLLFCFSLS